MSVVYQRALFTTQYLLGKRGDDIASARCLPTHPEAGQHLAGLQHHDRNVRAKHLARGLQELNNALEARRLDVG